MQVIKRNGSKEEFDISKINKAVKKAFNSCNKKMPQYLGDMIYALFSTLDGNTIGIEEIQNKVEEILMNNKFFDVAKNFILYRERHKNIRDFVRRKEKFINNYKKSSNTANATVDDNSNVSNKNIGILNAEIHKEDNIEISRGMITNKLKELFPELDHKSYINDLNHHIIYKHDESSFAGAISPYCVSISMYPFLLNGIKGIGGLSAAPKNLDSFCGMYINLIFATSAMYAGAVATSEFFVYFDYFARKEWGDDYYKNPDKSISINTLREKTIKSQIHQYFQQVIYSINQPAAARGMQSAFVNFSYFDKPFFEGMFGNFYFPDGSQPIWESLSWLQRDFMQWFNAERLRTMMTFPVESFALVFKDGEFIDKNSAEFVAEEYARGHSFFTYISDTVDSLSSCCRLKNKVQTKEFSFTNGNLGIQTGSKSVITLNLNRIIQDWYNSNCWHSDDLGEHKFKKEFIIQDSRKKESLKTYLINILERVYKYHIAYNELLWDMYDANLLPVYKEGFISLDNQYLTIGINGLNQAAEFLGMECNNNSTYRDFCRLIFTTLKESNSKANGMFNGHKLTFNTECVPAESLAIKNYNWDKKDNYWVPNDTNLYASYIYKPNDEKISILDKFNLHGNSFANDCLDGGVAFHCNLDHHLSKEQYSKLLKYAGSTGCSYFTFNIPNCECNKCGYIAKQPFEECPKCGSHSISLYDRIIGYLTKISNWSSGRQTEQKTRIYHKNIKV